MDFEQQAISAPLALLAIPTLLAVAYSIYLKLTASSEFPPEVPWVGLHKGLFSGLRTRLASLGNGTLGVIGAGYREFSASGRSFILPGFDRSMVIVPGSQVKWIVNQADGVLNTGAMQREVLMSDYSLLDPIIARNPLHQRIIHRELTRAIGSLIPDVLDELSTAIDDDWGSDKENWKDIGVYHTMEKVISRTSNRVFVGLPLCRNEEYLTNVASFAGDVPLSAAFIKLIPDILKPVLAWIPLIPNRRHFSKAAKHLVPYIKQRLADLQEIKKFGDAKSEPNDFITWFIHDLEQAPDPAERTPERIAHRLITVNFAAIHTSTFTATNLMFDLFSTPLESGYVQGIREEIEQVLAENNGKWDKVSLGKLVKTDSAIRESLRVSTFMTHGMHRLVVDKKGLTMEDGIHLPYGTRIATSTYWIHHDEDNYDDCTKYDAFRFSRAREDISASSLDLDKDSPSPDGTSRREDLAKVLESKNLSSVTTSDTFLSFGHGRHACPGRFFATTEMKLLLIYIIMNYDIEPLMPRPKNMYIGGNILPPMRATIRVKRRKS